MGGVAVVDCQFSKAKYYDDVCCAITTRICDNNAVYLIVDEEIMNEEIKTQVAFNLDCGKFAKMHEISRRVFNPNGIAPTQHCCGGGNREIKVVVPVNATKEGLASTITTAHHYKGNIVDPKRGQTEMGVVEITKENVVVDRGNFVSKQNQDGIFENRSYNRVWKQESPYSGAANCTKETEILTNTLVRRRIRKLTERECFRLMGVDDKDIDTIKSAGISKTQQYKMAGNSIVVDVIYHIFNKLFIDTKNDNQQLTLF